MKTIDLTDEELDLLVEMLNEELPALHHEIHHTDARAMRDELNARLRVITRLTERLSENAPEPVSESAAAVGPFRAQ